MKPWLLLTLLPLLLPAPLGAETVDLRRALLDAVQLRPSSAAARDASEAAEAGRVEARSDLLPHLSVSENLLWTDEPAGSLFISLNQEDLKLSNTADAYNYPPSRKDFETRVTLRQSLYDPDAWYGLRRADAEARAAEARARWGADDAAFTAFRAYLEVQRAHGASAWAEASRREALETVRLAARRREAGLGLKADELQAQVALAEAERRQLTTDNDLLLARLTLALSMGRAGQKVDIAAPLTEELFAGLPKDHAIRRADQEALAEESEAARLARSQSHADWLPRASLEASYILHDGRTPFGAEADAWSLQARLQWDLFDGLRRQGQQARTAAELRAAHNREMESSCMSRFAVEQARLRAEEAQWQLNSARRAVILAEESRRLTLQRYEAGLSPLVEMLAAQSALDRARFTALSAECGRILALGNILFQQGRFLTDLLPTMKDEP